jgi:hypothetical protein
MFYFSKIGAGAFFPPPLSLAAAINVAANQRQRTNAFSQLSPPSQQQQFSRAKIFAGKFSSNIEARNTD